MSVLFLVLDGLPARHVGRRHTPALAALADEGGRAPSGGRAVLPSSTYPNHATFVTGADPSGHGIHGNHVVDGTPVDGVAVRDAADVGARGTTLFDACRAAGRSSAAVLGDQHLVGVLRAAAADTCWPPRGVLPVGAARDELGYAADTEVAARLVRVLEAAPDLVVAHLNEPDTAGHRYGPDSEAALARYRATDDVLAGVLDVLRPHWEQWAVVVVSDHDQETVTVAEPVDLTAAARAAGVDVTVVAEGGSALLHGADPDTRRLAGTPGVAGHRMVGDRLRMVWAEPGRWFGDRPAPLRGVHGSPRQATQVAVCGGGPPAVASLAGVLARSRPAAGDWYRTVLRLADPVPVRSAP